MVAWWALDELGGAVAWDGVAGNNGTAEGGATVTSPAKVAAGRSFDGTTGRVLVPGAPALDPGSGDFSVDAWIQPQALDGVRPIVAKQYAPADSPLGWALVLMDGAPSFRMGNAAGGIVATAPFTLTVDTQWHLLAVTVRRAALAGGQIFVDGALVHSFDTTPLVGAVDTPADLEIAAQPALGRGSPARFFSGGLDEVELFHRALAAAEVHAIYTADAAGKCDKPPTPTPRPTVAGPLARPVARPPWPTRFRSGPPKATRWQPR
jgi:hypothetical protein